MLVVRKPSRETDLGRKSFVPCDRRGSGLHISEIRRRPENPLAAKKQCVRYSHPIVSQNQTKSDGVKTPVCISNRKKSKCHLSRCVTNSYVDMRMRQPDSSEFNILGSTIHTGGDEMPRCLFCGQEHEKLSAEHVFPAALGGNLELRDGVCTKCNNDFSEFERALVKELVPVRLL